MSNTNGHSRLHVKKLRFRMVGGIEDFEVDADGQLVRFEGPNASGKTSAAEGFRLLTAGGNNIPLLRGDAEEGEVYALLSNHMEVVKTFSRDGFKLVVRDAETGERVKGGEQTWLEQHFDTLLGVNPADILRAEPKNRGQLLLESIPKQISLDELREAIGMAVELTDDVDAEGLGETVEYVDTSQHALQAIAQIRKRIYTRRRDVNRDAKNKDGAIKEARASLPENLDEIETAEDVRARRDGYTQELEAVKAEANAEGEQLADEARAKSKRADADADSKIEEINLKIEELKIRLQQLKDDRFEIDQNRKERKLQIRADFNEAKTEALQKYQPKITELRSQIDSADQAIEHAAERANSLKIMRQHQAEKEGLEARSDELTTALESLDDLKASLLADLPIEGIEIGEDGNIYNADGVPFEQTNTAEQVEIACTVVAQRDGGVVFIDRVESLDSNTFRQLVGRLTELGFQVWTFEVSERPGLKVLTGEEAFTTPRPREAAAEAQS